MAPRASRARALAIALTATAVTAGAAPIAAGASTPLALAGLAAGAPVAAPAPVQQVVGSVQQAANNAGSTTQQVVSGVGHVVAPVTGGQQSSPGHSTPAPAAQPSSPTSSAAGGSGAAAGGATGAARSASGSGATASTSSGGRGGAAGGGRATTRSRSRGARAARGRHSARRAAARAGHRSKAKPTSHGTLAHDIRTIVRVVPTPLKILIAILAALALAFGLRSRLAGARARRLDRQRRDLLGDVGLLQRALLPELPATTPGLDVSVAYRPAEGPAAGGDFYDVFQLDDARTAIIVGDVMGHGREALAVTALMRYSLRAYLSAGLEPRAALRVAARALESDPNGEVTTVVVAVHDATASTLTYACAGHEPPIVIGAPAHEPVIACSAPPIGGFMETGQRQTTITLTAGTRLCLFTDGIVEARVADGLLGRERLARLFGDLDGSDAEELVGRVVAHADRTPDDMAACVIRCRSGATGPGPRVEELEVSGSDLQRRRLEGFLRGCGVPAPEIAATVDGVRAQISDLCGAIVRVTIDEGGRGTAYVLPREGPTVEVPLAEPDREPV